MLYFLFNRQNLVLVGVQEDVTEQECKQYHCTNRNDFATFADAEILAKSATEMTGEVYLPVDRGGHHYPRYDVMKAPKVGDEVSYAFNGDYYPDGEILSISETFKTIRTSNGHRYFRSGYKGGWKRDGCWSLVQGHVSKLNPEF